MPKQRTCVDCQHHTIEQEWILFWKSNGIATYRNAEGGMRTTNIRIPTYNGTIDFYLYPEKIVAHFQPKYEAYEVEGWRRTTLAGVADDRVEAKTFSELSQQLKQMTVTLLLYENPNSEDLYWMDQCRLERGGHMVVPKDKQIRMKPDLRDTFFR
jgi:hypothetical protein